MFVSNFLMFECDARSCAACSAPASSGELSIRIFNLNRGFRVSNERFLASLHPITIRLWLKRTLPLGTIDSEARPWRRRCIMLFGIAVFYLVAQSLILAASLFFF